MKVSLGKIDEVDLYKLIEDLKSSSNNVGCIILFIGVVRREAASGGSVSHLYYEAYEELAIKKLKEIVDDAIDGERVFAACIHHALGRIDVGKETMYVGVAAKHRSDGFNAIQDMIDKIKSEVPIWKKEVTDKGEYWIH